MFEIIFKRLIAAGLVFDARPRIVFSLKRLRIAPVLKVEHHTCDSERCNDDESENHLRPFQLHARRAAELSGTSSHLRRGSAFA